METKELLETRGEIYGDYIGNVHTRLDLMETIEKRYNSVHKDIMGPLEWMFFWDIIAKLARLAVTPTHVDSWKDIIGYSTLVLTHLEKEKEENII